MLWPCRLLESDTLDPRSEKRAIRQGTAWEFACIYLSWLLRAPEHLISQMLLHCQLLLTQKALAHLPAACSFLLGLSLSGGGAPIRNSPKLTSLKSHLYQHDSPSSPNYRDVLRLLAEVLPKPVSLVSLAASLSPCFIYPLPCFISWAA